MSCLAAALLLVPGCAEFIGYEPDPGSLRPPATPVEVIGSGGTPCPRLWVYQPRKSRRVHVSNGARRACDAIWDPRLDIVFKEAFGDGRLATRIVAGDSSPRLEEGAKILAAMRSQLPDLTVHVLVVPRLHELARSDFGMVAVSLTPRRLDGHAFVDTFTHELSHLLAAPSGESREQWLQDTGHGETIPTRRYASYFIGHAAACASRLPDVDAAAIRECSEGPR